MERRAACSLQSPQDTPRDEVSSALDDYRAFIDSYWSQSFSIGQLEVACHRQHPAPGQDLGTPGKRTFVPFWCFRAQALQWDYSGLCHPFCSCRVERHHVGQDWYIVMVNIQQQSRRRNQVKRSRLFTSPIFQKSLGLSSLSVCG